MRPIFNRALYIVGFLIPTFAFANFYDVPASHPNAEAIAYVQTQGIVEGYSDNAFQPDRVINRAEFAKILGGYMVAEAELSGCQRSLYLQYRDVPENAWYTKHLCVLAKASIVHLPPEATFRPDAPINFVEAAKIIDGAMRVKQGMEAQHLEASIPWYKSFVDSLENYR